MAAPVSTLGARLLDVDSLLRAHPDREDALIAEECQVPDWRVSERRAALAGLFLEDAIRILVAPYRLRSDYRPSEPR